VAPADFVTGRSQVFQNANARNGKACCNRFQGVSAAFVSAALGNIVQRSARLSVKLAQHSESARFWRRQRRLVFSRISPGIGLVRILEQQVLT
jgi:hypothetical protein